MAKIQVGQFGNELPQPQYPRDQGRVRVGEGLAQLGETLQRMGRQKEAEAKEAQKNGAYVSAAKFENALEAKRTDLLDREARGEVKTDELDQHWQEETQMLREHAMAELPEESRHEYGYLFDLRQLDQSGKFVTQQRGRIQENLVRDLDTGIQANAQIAIKDPARAIGLTEQLVDGTAPNADISPDKATEIKAKFRDRAWENNLRNKLVDSGRISEVKDIRKQLDELNNFPGMTPETRLQLKSYADSKRHALEAEYEAAGRMARAEAKSNLDGITRDLMSGREIPVDTVIQYGDYIKGLPNDIPEKQQATIAQELHPQIRMMLAMRPDERARFLNQKESDLDGLSGKDRLAALTRLNILDEAARGIERRNDNDPYGQLEAYTGQTVPPLDPGGDIVAQTTARNTYAARAQAMTGKNPGLYKPDENTVMAKGILGMTQEQYEAYMDGMRKNPQRPLVDQTFKNLAQAEPAVGYAGAYSMVGPTGARDSEGRDVGAMILRGKKAIEHKSLKMPDESFFRTNFDEASGGAFAGSEAARGAAYDLVRNYYAAIATTSDKPISGTGDTSIFGRSFRAIMGSDAPATVNKAQVFPPYGMAPSEFQAGFSLALDNALDASGITYTADGRKALHERAKPRQADGMGNYWMEYPAGDWLVYPAGHAHAGDRLMVHVDSDTPRARIIEASNPTAGGAKFQ